MGTDIIRFTAFDYPFGNFEALLHYIVEESELTGEIHRPTEVIDKLNCIKLYKVHLIIKLYRR